MESKQSKRDALAAEIDAEKNILRGLEISLESTPAQIERIDAEILRLLDKKTSLESDLEKLPGLIEKTRNKLAKLTSQATYTPEPRFYGPRKTSKQKLVTKIQILSAEIRALKKQLPPDFDFSKLLKG